MKSQLMEELRQARQSLLGSVRHLSEGEAAASNSLGAWSVKDVLAHMVFWDEEFLRGMNSLLRGDRPGFLDEDWDRLNQREVEKRRGQSLNELLLELERTGNEVLQFVGGLDETEISSSRGEKWKTWDVTIEWLVSGNIEHERHHTSKILSWRRKTAS
jgi:uncharacterized damage-inducible protein DinB